MNKLIVEDRAEITLKSHSLSAVLLARLDEIADFHGGRVPLHGRLFAHWRHHAYPRECLFPHVAGTTSPVSQAEFAGQVGMDKLEVSRCAMEEHASRASMSLEVPMALPWTPEEQLAAENKHDGELGRSFVSLQSLAALFALASFALPLVSAGRHAFASPALDSPVCSPPVLRAEAWVVREGP